MGSPGQAAGLAAEAGPGWVPGAPAALRLSRHRRASGRSCLPAEMRTLRSTTPRPSGECRLVPHCKHSQRSSPLSVDPPDFSSVSYHNRGSIKVHCAAGPTL